MILLQFSTSMSQTLRVDSLNFVLTEFFVNDLKLNKMRQQRFEAAESLKFSLSVSHLVKPNDPGMADELFLADGWRWRLY